jgi:hypothetical protein
MNISALNELMGKWEPIWLFIILFTETLAGYATLYILIKEYNYDFQKDVEKKQRRTKTSKKTTTSATGQSTVEETSEVIEPIEMKEGPK